MQYSRSENVDPKIFVRKSLKCIWDIPKCNHLVSLLKLLVCYIKLILCIWLAKMIGVKCSPWNCVHCAADVVIYNNE